MEKNRLWFRPTRKGFGGLAIHQGLQVKLCPKIFSGAMCEVCNLAERQKLKGFSGGELEVFLILHKSFSPWGERRYYIAHLSSIPPEVVRGLVRIDEGGEIDFSGINAVICTSAKKGLLIDPGSMGFNDEGFSLRQFIGGREIIATVVTHGHNDHRNHLREVERGPVFMTELASQLAWRDASWHSDTQLIQVLRRVKKIVPGKSVFLNDFPFQVETFPLPHSIPETMGLVVRGQKGRLVHLGDFKFNGMEPRTKAELIARLSKIAKEPVDYLALNIVNAHIDGFTPIEALAIDAFTDIIVGAKGRVIITCFSTNLERIGRLVEVAQLLGRPVQFFGAGMQNAQESELLKELLRKGQEGLDSGKAILFVTGCQAEEYSVLWQIAKGRNPPFALQANDILASSARCIPGKEKELHWLYVKLRPKVDRLIVNKGEIEQLDLKDLGAEESWIHFSGHEQGGGLRLALEIIRPRKGVIAGPQTSPQIEAFRKIAEPLGIKVLDEKERFVEI